MKRTALGLALASLLAAQGALGDAKDYYFRRAQKQAPGDALVAASLFAREYLFDQRIDHDSATDARTFKQRYFLDSSLARNSASPVFLMICGEATCEPSALSGAIAQMARKHGAHLLAVEHRYYGKSQPFDRLTTANMKFLTTDYALKDLAAIQRHLTRELGLSGKWVAWGGSYAGSLAAYYRQKYPELVVGALSSSGPVLAKENFEEYDLHVGAVAGPECSARIKKAVAQVEADLGDAARLSQHKKAFQAEALTDNDDFLYLIADIAAFAIQYGMKDAFCGSLGEQDPLDGYAAFARQIFALFGLNATSTSAAGAVSLDPKDYENGFGIRQWFYQSCAEYGYWQNAYPDPKLSVRSARINLAYHRGICKRLYGLETPTEIDRVNWTFYQPLLDPKTASAIYFTNGSTDPWSKLSITPENGNATNPATPAFVIEGAAHCDDLAGASAGDSASMKKARQVFSDLLDAWLR